MCLDEQLSFFFFFKWHIFKTIHANTYIALSTSDVPVASLHKHDLTLLSSVLLRRKLQPISPLICQLGAAGNLSAPLLQMDILLLRAIPQQFVRTQPWQNDCVISSQGVIFLTAIFFWRFLGIHTSTTSSSCRFSSTIPHTGKKQILEGEQPCS